MAFPRTEDAARLWRQREYLVPSTYRMRLRTRIYSLGYSIRSTICESYSDMYRSLIACSPGGTVTSQQPLTTPPDCAIGPNHTPPADWHTPTPTKLPQRSRKENRGQIASLCAFLPNSGPTVSKRGLSCSEVAARQAGDGDGPSLQHPHSRLRSRAFFPGASIPSRGILPCHSCGDVGITGPAVSPGWPMLRQPSSLRSGRSLLTALHVHGQSLINRGIYSNESHMSCGRRSNTNLFRPGKGVS